MQSLFSPYIKKDGPTKEDQNVQITVFVSILACLFGCALNGSWLLPVVYVYHMIVGQNLSSHHNTYVSDSNVHKYVHDYFCLLSINIVFSIIVYFLIGGFIHYHFYVKQRSHPETWKCQPYKFISPELERHEILLGLYSIVLGSMIFTSLSTYILHGGKTFIYDNISDYGWTWFILSIPFQFLFMEFVTYFLHIFLHTRFMYVRFHKVHHLFKQPTAFSVTAMHPVEFITLQLPLLMPPFLFPVHTVVYFSTLLYLYYYGIMAHCGVMIKPLWPWQPEPLFHDNHHLFFHVNYGANLDIWDKLFGTYRDKTRVYSEKIFGGKGKAMNEATQEEIKQYNEESQNQIDYVQINNNNN